jgi:hypothetical protein
MKHRLILSAVVVLVALGFAACQPSTVNHYTANGNFAGSTYSPGVDKFNLADVSSNDATAALPPGVRGLVWLGTCNGADTSFKTHISTFVGDAKVYGFYVMDEPNPNTCPAANLMAESDYIHATLPGAKTFIIEQDLSSSNHPDYLPNAFAPAGGYNPANSHIDLYGLDPYPCRTENPASAPCAYLWINLAVTAAEAEGIPLADIVPVYQAFGGGNWTDDGGGHYQLPTPAQETQILNQWGSVVPKPAFDYAYSWGVQNGDTSLSESPGLQAIFATHNG